MYGDLSMAGEGKGAGCIYHNLTVFDSVLQFSSFCVIINIYSLDNFADMGLESKIRSQGGCR
jgi:hypothetical protein